MSPDVSETFKHFVTSVLTLNAETTTHSLMKLAGRQNASPRDPPLLDMVSARFSPCTPAVQTLGGMLHGSHDIVALLCLALDLRSLSELVARDPQLALWYRKAVVSSSVQLFLRFVLNVRQWPWPLARLVDARLSQHDRDEVCEQFIACCIECLDPGFGKILKPKVTSIADFKGSGSQLFAFPPQVRTQLHVVPLSVTCLIQSLFVLCVCGLWGRSGSSLFAACFCLRDKVRHITTDLHLCLSGRLQHSRS
jgi:hypothetical protein